MKKKEENGALVISIDFELFWGLADFADINEWAKRIKKVHYVIPKILQLFSKYNIHATWATVGGILAEDKDDFLYYLAKPLNPQIRAVVDKLWPSNSSKPNCPNDMLFAPGLVAEIYNSPGQELGTHTYSHYYCEKPNSTIKDFRNELESSTKIFLDKGYVIPNSIVFPRNQVSKQYIYELSTINNYRGNESGVITLLKKKVPKVGTLLWYIDHYFPLRRFRSYRISECLDNNHVNVRQSRFFKVYKSKYRIFENLKINRYKKEMLFAAKQHEIYHICWHPHNFSENTEINLQQLEVLLKYFCYLNKLYAFESLSMSEVAKKLRTSKFIAKP